MNEEEKMLLEQRKVKALEKIANSLDALTIWFEEIDKVEWGERIQWYLAEFHAKMVVEAGQKIVENTTIESTSEIKPEEVKVSKKTKK